MYLFLQERTISHQCVEGGIIIRYYNSGGGTMANTKSTVNVKIDAHVKEAATALLARMGIDQTTAIEMYYRKIIAVKALPFQPEPLPSTEEQLLAAIKRKNIPHKTVEVNAEGHIIVDKDQGPELYDWTVNG
jgi:addiction module RelB/DinJ family antitoxin